MKTTTRQPKITKARGASLIPIGKPVDATTNASLEAGIEERKRKEASLAEAADLAWLTAGSLAYLQFSMEIASPPSKGDMEGLRPTTYLPRFARGTPVIFVEAKRIQITHAKLGPMRIVRHVWITPGGGKYTIQLKHLQKDLVDEL
jgi:hypothetical protein